MKMPKRQRYFVFLTLIITFSLFLVFSVKAVTFPAQEGKPPPTSAQIIDRTVQNLEHTVQSVREATVPVQIVIVPIVQTVELAGSNLFDRTVQNLQHTSRSVKEAIEDIGGLLARPEAELKPTEVLVTVPQLSPKSVLEGPPTPAALQPEVIRETVREVVREQIIQEIRLNIPSLPAALLVPPVQISQEIIREVVIRETIIREVDNSALNALNQSIQQQIASLQTMIGQSSPTADDLDITDDDVPDDITVSKYLPLAGGTMEGNISLPRLLATTSIGFSSSTPGAALGVKGAALFEGFVSADYFTSSSTNDSWLFGNLGIGTSTPGSLLSVQGLGNLGSLTVEGETRISFLISTSTTNSGFGTTSPWGFLSVEQIDSSDENFPAFVVSDQGTSTPSFVILNRNGSVGIGTTSPGTLLDVAGIGVFKGGLTVEATSTASAFIATSTLEVRGAGGTDFMVVDGRVGVGTTSPTKRLVVISSETGDGIIIDGAGSNSPALFLYGDSASVASSTIGLALSSENFSVDATIGDLVIRDGGDDIIFSTTGAGNYPAEMIIKNGGNIGIGTVAPSQLLEIAGASVLGGNVEVITDLFIYGSDLNIGNGDQATTTISGQYGLLGLASTTPWGQLSLEYDGAVLGSSTPVFVISDSGTSTPSFIITSTGRIGIATTTFLTENATANTGIGLTIATSTYIEGGLGIGVATTSNGGLFVKGSADIYDGLIVRGGRVGIATTSPGGRLSISDDRSTPALLINQTGTGDLINIQNGGITEFVIRDNGNIGIGTSTPLEALTIDANTQNALTITTNSVGSDTDVEILNSSGEGGRFTAVGVSGDFAFYRVSPGSSNFAMTIRQSNQNVGVGTSSPGAAFAIADDDGSQPVFLISTSTSAGSTAFLMDSDGKIILGGIKDQALGALSLSGQGLNEGIAFFDGNNTSARIFMGSDDLFYVGARSAVLARGLVIDENGNTGFGVLGAQTGTHVCFNTTDISSFNVFTDCSSSESIKKNINYLTSEDYGAMLIDIRNTDIATFNYKADATGTPPTFGIIAEYSPENVQYIDSRGNANINEWSVNIGYTWGAIKALDKQIQELQLGSSDNQGFFAQIIDTILNKIKEWFQNTLISIKELATEKLSALMINTLKLRVGTPDNPAGITVYDFESRQPHCLIVRSGQVESIPGECTFEAASPPSSDSVEPLVDEPPTEEPPIEEEPPSDEPPAEEPPAEEPPADEPPIEGATTSGSGDLPPEASTEEGGPLTDEPPTEEPPADEPLADEPPIEEPTTEEPPADESPVNEPPPPTGGEEPPSGEPTEPLTE